MSKFRFKKDHVKNLKVQFEIGADEWGTHTVTAHLGSVTESIKCESLRDIRCAQKTLTHILKERVMG